MDPKWCQNPKTELHEIPDEARRISLIRVDWGGDDLREDWQGAYHFCSFGCLSDWAAEKAEQHDNRVLHSVPEVP